MAKLFVLNDLKQFEAWLKTQPREVCIAIAARVALRVVPLVAFDLQTKGEILLSPSEVSRNIALPVMRAVALTLAAVKYPAKIEVLIPFASSVANGSAIARAAVVDAVHSPVLKPKDSAFYDDATIAAARAAARWAMSHKDAVLYDRSAPAHFAAEATAASANASADAVGADVAPVVFSAAGRAVTFSIRAMELTGTNAGATYASDAQVIVSGGTIQGLIGTPLWPQGTPEWALQNWRDLRRTLNAERQDWDVWTRWYDAVLEGRPTPGGEDLDIYRVTLDSEEDWKKGPAHVNALIKKKEEELAERKQPNPDYSGAVVDGSAFDFGEQNTIAISFGVTDSGIVDVLQGAGADRVSTGIDSIDGHAEVKRYAEILIANHEEGERDPNNGNAMAYDEARLLRQALGNDIANIRPGLLIPRGEALRQTLDRQRNRQDLSDIPPLSEKMLDALGKLVGAYNVFVLTDKELSRRDQALLGPDAKTKLVPPEDAVKVAESAVSLGVATPEAAKAIAEEAANSPETPDLENRNSRRLSATARNFGRALLGRVQSFVRWVRNNPIKSYAVLRVPYGAAQWALRNETWLLNYFADSPAMLSAVQSLTGFLKSIPL